MAEIVSVRPERLNKGDRVEVVLTEAVGLLSGDRQELQITRDGDMKTALSLTLTPSEELRLIKQLINS